jgi:hypothetical protein
MLGHYNRHKHMHQVYNTNTIMHYNRYKQILAPRVQHIHNDNGIRTHLEIDAHNRELQQIHTHIHTNTYAHLENEKTMHWMDMPTT